MINIDKNISVVKEVSVEASFKAILFSNGIIEIIFNQDIQTVKEKHIAQIRQVVYELGEGKKMPVFLSSGDFVNISDEGRKYAATEEVGRYTLANAVLIDNLAKKIIFNFFLNLNKPKTPTKGFSNRNDAFQWLEKLHKENQKLG